MTASLALALLTFNISTIMAKDAVLGSPDFRVSAEQPVGWRGDGTGKYPGANPPVHWGRSLKQLGDLKCAAAAPKDNSSAGATPATTGFFTEWLVAGPFSCAGLTNAIAQEVMPGEASFAPREGDKLGNAIWQMVKVEDSFIDLFRPLGIMTNDQAAYAQACLYVEKPAKIWFHLNHARGLVLWLNGAREYTNPDTPVNNGGGDMGPTLELQLQAGWNRFLFKLTPRMGMGNFDFPKTCFVRCRFWPSEEPRDYASTNISWIVRMPGLTQANPIIAGDFLFTMAHPYNLVCVDKKTGKIVWIRQNSPYDAATPEERKAKPEVFAKLDPLAAKRELFYQDYLLGKQPDEAAVKEESKLENELDKIMLEVDRVKYKRPDEQGEPDWWTIPTPASEGSGVFVWLTRGTRACYGLDGKRRWIRYERPKYQHHGYYSAPVIADRKFVIMDGTITAFDLSDGSAKWSVGLENASKTKGWRNWGGSLSRAVFKDTEYVLCPGGNILVRARDGQVFGSQGWGNWVSTPIFEGDAAWQNSPDGVLKYTVEATTNNGLAIKQPGQSVKLPEQLPLGLNFYQGKSLVTSPLIYDGLGYTVSGDGVLKVFDVVTMEGVYQKELPIDLFAAAHQRSYFGASLALAGGHIYLMGATGVTIVIKPGRTYEEVARNRIQYLARSGRALGNYGYWCNRKYCPEYQDNTMTSTPVFDGNRMYFRGEENLYCIEEQGKKQ